MKPKPPTPDGYPNNYIQVLFFDGPCAIPLQSGDDWVWYAFYNGAPLLRRGKWGPDSQHASFEAALEFTQGYLEWRKEQVMKMVGIGSKEKIEFNIADFLEATDPTDGGASAAAQLEEAIRAVATHCYETGRTGVVTLDLLFAPEQHPEFGKGVKTAGDVSVSLEPEDKPKQEN